MSCANWVGGDSSLSLVPGSCQRVFKFVVSRPVLWNIGEGFLYHLPGLKLARRRAEGVGGPRLGEALGTRFLGCGK